VTGNGKQSFFKKGQKTFVSLAATALTKVFYFFFPKKKALLLIPTAQKADSQ